MRALALVLLGGVSLFAQTSSSVSLSNGVRLRIVASYGRPTGVQNLTSELSPASGDSFYRILRDDTKLAVFAYELEVQRTADGDHITITTKPAGSAFAQKFPNADGGKPTPTVSAPRQYEPLASGQRLSIPLFSNEGTGIEVIDTVEVRLGRGGAAAASVDGQLRFSALRVFMNQAQAASGSGDVAGRYLMFYLPGQGGYFFSSNQPEGRPFIKAGWIDRTRMQFSIDNVTFECISAAPILAGNGRGEIWVYRDANYKPAGNWTLDTQTSRRRAEDEFFAAAADSLQWWLP